MKDSDDMFLQELFASAPIEDNGFSRKLMRRLKRRIWIDRLALPIGALIGAAFAVQPLLDLASVLPAISGMLPASFSLPETSIEPGLQTILVASVILIGGIGVLQLAED